MILVGRLAIYENDISGMHGCNATEVPYGDIDYSRVRIGGF